MLPLSRRMSPATGVILPLLANVVEFRPSEVQRLPLAALNSRLQQRRLEASCSVVNVPIVQKISPHIAERLRLFTLGQESHSPSRSRTWIPPGTLSGCLAISLCCGNTLSFRRGIQNAQCGLSLWFSSLVCHTIGR